MHRHLRCTVPGCTHPPDALQSRRHIIAAAEAHVLFQQRLAAAEATVPAAPFAAVPPAGPPPVSLAAARAERGINTYDDDDRDAGDDGADIVTSVGLEAPYAENPPVLPVDRSHSGHCDGQGGLVSHYNGKLYHTPPGCVLDSSGEWPQGLFNNSDFRYLSHPLGTPVPCSWFPYAKDRALAALLMPLDFVCEQSLVAVTVPHRWTSVGAAAAGFVHPGRDYAHTRELLLPMNSLIARFHHHPYGFADVHCRASVLKGGTHIILGPKPLCEKVATVKCVDATCVRVASALRASRLPGILGPREVSVSDRCCCRHLYP